MEPEAENLHPTTRRPLCPDNKDNHHKQANDPDDSPKPPLLNEPNGESNKENYRKQYKEDFPKAQYALQRRSPRGKSLGLPVRLAVLWLFHNPCIPIEPRPDLPVQLALHFCIGLSGP